MELTRRNAANHTHVGPVKEWSQAPFSSNPWSEENRQVRRSEAVYSWLSIDRGSLRLGMTREADLLKETLREEEETAFELERMSKKLGQALPMEEEEEEEAEGPTRSLSEIIRGATR
jgi:hypothetical protein